MNVCQDLRSEVKIAATLGLLEAIHFVVTRDGAIHVIHLGLDVRSIDLREWLCRFWEIGRRGRLDCSDGELEALLAEEVFQELAHGLLFLEKGRLALSVVVVVIVVRVVIVIVVIVSVVITVRGNLDVWVVVLSGVVEVGKGILTVVGDAAQLVTQLIAQLIAQLVAKLVHLGVVPWAIGQSVLTVALYIVQHQGRDVCQSR